MTSCRIIKLIILSAITCLAIAASAQDEEHPPIKWEEDIASALKESYLTGKPVILHFCPEGRIALNEDMSTLQDNRVKAIAMHFAWVRLDPEKYRELGDKYGVKEIPSIVIVNHEKEKLHKKKCEGHAFPEDIFALVAEIKGKVKFVDPKDIEKLRKASKDAGKYLEKGKISKAVGLLRKIERFKREIGFVLEARKALAAMEEKARQDIEQAKKLVTEGKQTEGDKLLKKIESDMRGLDVAAEAKKVRLELYRSKKGMGDLKEKQQEEEARKLLRTAQMYEDNKMPEKALTKYEEILEKYPRTESAGPASDKVRELRQSLGKKENK